MESARTDRRNAVRNGELSGGVLIACNRCSSFSEIICNSFIVGEISGSRREGSRGLRSGREALLDGDFDGTLRLADVLGGSGDGVRAVRFLMPFILPDELTVAMSLLALFRVNLADEPSPRA